ncbi:hypothetical protein BT96DRAFT_1020507 [Gymnopus androsaceus JB14]|uniref:F-box domain-containing protein n=1 Tax=Gymnopus androsaceus JB14 TaxID=1447944 RepID=A0A6A4HL90_9AGAR|nr:hypothetical protein BT96DRAFT_1020507 [Gymnopus androsaceus JB14]
MMTMERRIPNELVDLILENLYLDTDTLRNCALVGKAWVSSSQRGIFREIVLSMLSPMNMDANLKVARHLDTLFSEKPYMASFVRSLELRSFGRSGPAVALTNVCQAPSVTRFSTIDSWFRTFAELVSLLSRMRNLKVLAVDMSCFDWNVPNSLSELEIEEASLPPRSIQLEELRLGIIPCFMTWFQRDWCPFDVHHLNSLDIPSEVDMVTLQYFGTGLRELTLRGIPGTLVVGRSDFNYAHLQYTPNLRKLSLRDLDEYMFHAVAWIKALFEPLLNSEGNIVPFQHLNIDLSSRTLHLNRWSEFDELLEKPEFASIETVDFRVSETLGAQVLDMFRKKLPSLDASKKLTVQEVNWKKEFKLDF